jgi:gas vesicle protein
MFKNKFPYGKVTFAFIIGAAAGAAAAFLLTPYTGKKMQMKVANAIEDQVDNVEKIVKKVVNA